MIVPAPIELSLTQNSLVSSTIHELSINTHEIATTQTITGTADAAAAETHDSLYCETVPFGCWRRRGLHRCDRTAASIGNVLCQKIERMGNRISESVLGTVGSELVHAFRQVLILIIYAIVALKIRYCVEERKEVGLIAIIFIVAFTIFTLMQNLYFCYIRKYCSDRFWGVERQTPYYFATFYFCFGAIAYSLFWVRFGLWIAEEDRLGRELAWVFMATGVCELLLDALLLYVLYFVCLLLLLLLAVLSYMVYLPTYALYCCCCGGCSEVTDLQQGAIWLGEVLRRHSVMYSQGISSDQCSICQASYTLESRVVVLDHQTPSHVFHEECIRRWLLESNRCPLCKSLVFNPEMRKALSFPED